MKVYSPNNTLLIDIDVDDDSFRYKEIMGDNILILKFSLPYYIEIVEGSWCDFKAERYYMPKSQDFVKQHTEHFDYTLPMEGSIMKTKATKFKFFMPVRTSGIATSVIGSFSLRFSLSATPKQFAQLFVDNLNLKFPREKWQIGDCIDSAPVTLDFNHDLCFDVLHKFAEAFNTEWEVDNWTIHLRRVEKMKDSAIDLSYGYDNGILSGIKRTQYNDSHIINRVYIDGSDRNIDRKTYGNGTLLMPKNKTIVYEGISYKTDTSGSYVQRVTPLPGREDSLDVTKHYPHRIGTVSKVITIDAAKGLYDIIDNSISAELDFSKLILPNEKMTIIFQDSKQLAGQEYDINYIHSDRRFQIVPKNNSGQTTPSGSIIPTVGDTYAVFHMSMPSNYITEAETNVLNDTVKYLWEGEQPKYTYELPLDRIYAKREWSKIGGFLNTGYFIKFSDSQFLPVGVAIRIIAVKEPVNDPQSPILTIANNVSGRTLGSALNKIPTQETAIDRKDQAIREYARRRYSDVLEFAEAVKGMVDDFENDFMSAAVFESMTFRAGAESLQYQFLAENWATVIEPFIMYDKEHKQFKCDAARFQHMTLGIDSVKPEHQMSEFKFWTAPAFISAVLDPAKSYYLYLECSKTFSNVSGRQQGTATFILAPERRKIDHVSGKYTLWCAFLNSENMDGDRSWRTVYGFTEILPGSIMTNLIADSDNRFVINLLSSYLEVKNRSGASMVKLDGSDGSGYFSGGNLSWSASGQLLIRGRFETNKENDRIIIDPDRKSLEMIDSKNRVLCSISFNNDTLGGRGTIETFRYDNNGNRIGRVLVGSSEILIKDEIEKSITYISAGGVTIENEKLNHKLQLYAGTASLNSTMRIIAENLPKSDLYLERGQVWNDNGVLKISEGWQ